MSGSGLEEEFSVESSAVDIPTKKNRAERNNTKRNKAIEEDFRFSFIVFSRMKVGVGSNSGYSLAFTLCLV
jgi:hypothetical protein